MCVGGAGPRCADGWAGCGQAGAGGQAYKQVWRGVGPGGTVGAEGRSSRSELCFACLVVKMDRASAPFPPSSCRLPACPPARLHTCTPACLPACPPACLPAPLQLAELEYAAEELVQLESRVEAAESERDDAVERLRGMTPRPPVVAGALLGPGSDGQSEWRAGEGSSRTRGAAGRGGGWAE